MRSNFTLGLAAIAFGLGIAAASAATLDVNQLVSAKSAQAGHVPDQSLGHFSSGFAAIKSNRGSALKDGSADAFAPANAATHAPAEGHAWKHGFAALAPSSGLAPLSRSVAREALSPPAGMAASPKGLSALKGGAGTPDASFAGAQSLAPHASNELERPAGSNWSNGLDSIHIRR